MDDKELKRHVAHQLSSALAHARTVAERPEWLPVLEARLRYCEFMLRGMEGAANEAKELGALESSRIFGEIQALSAVHHAQRCGRASKRASDE